MPGRVEGGFSLIEVLVAVAVLAIGLTAGFKLQVLDLDLIRSGRSTTRATLAAESLLWRMAVTPPARGQVEEGELDGFSYRIVTRADESLPGLNRVDLILSETGSGAPAQTFRRLLVAATAGGEEGDQEDQGEEGQEGAEGGGEESGSKEGDGK
jgi:prepilin-type N-terminal cleavage/methylation domain-containing protein